MRKTGAAGLHYSYSLETAGEAMTQEIAKALKLSAEAAEELKIKTGLTGKADQLSSVLVKVLEPIMAEVKTAIKYFSQRNGETVKSLILVGGSSKLKGIADYFLTNLDIPVEIGQSKLSSREVPLEYLEAIGSGLRGLNKK